MKIAHHSGSSYKIKRKDTSLLLLQLKKQATLLKHVVTVCVCVVYLGFFSFLVRTPNKKMYLDMNFMVFIKIRKCHVRGV